MPYADHPGMAHTIPAPLAVVTRAPAGRHVAASGSAPEAGLALVRAGGRHAAYGSSTEFVLNAGNAAQVVADATGVSVARLLADPALTAEAVGTARRRAAERGAHWGTRLGLTRRARAERASAVQQQLLVERAADVLERAVATLRVQVS